MSTSAGQYVTYACPSYSHRVVNDTRYTFYSSTCSEYSNPALPDAPGSNEPDEGPRVRTEYLSCPEGAEFIIPVGKV